MFLFKPIKPFTTLALESIYITICFYLNDFERDIFFTNCIIYITVCFYLNNSAKLKYFCEIKFTLQYVSI